jgi:hypothetical protein
MGVKGGLWEFVKRIFEPKRQEVILKCIKLYNEEYHNLCTPPNIIRLQIKKDEIPRNWGK